MRSFLVYCFALIALAAPAWAGPPGGEAAAQEEELTAAPDSIDYGMIENAGADGVFEAILDGQVSVRHVASGMVCRFEREAQGRLILFPGLPRGEDVGCDLGGATHFVTFYATRYPGGSTLQSELAGAIAAMHARYGQTRMTPYTHGDGAAPGARLPDSLHARFIVDQAEGPVIYTRVSVAIVRGWSLKMRFTAVLSETTTAEAADLAANAIWAGHLSEVPVGDAL